MSRSAGERDGVAPAPRNGRAGGNADGEDVGVAGVFPAAAAADAPAAAIARTKSMGLRNAPPAPGA